MASFYYSAIERDRLSFQSESTEESRKRLRRDRVYDLDNRYDKSFRTKTPKSFDENQNLDTLTMTNDDILGEEIPWAHQNSLRKFCYEALNLGTGGIRGNCSTQFPGSHPVSLNKDNLQLIRRNYYYATWKADGTRYMMLMTIDGVYLIDRSFNFRRVKMRFPCRPRKGFGSLGEKTKTHHYTLLDGEMVIDTHTRQPGSKKKQERRYLVYDLMVINQVSVIDRPFHERWSMIEKEVIEPRNQERHSRNMLNDTCYYRYELEPFKVRRKDFWFLSTVPKLLKEFVPKQLSHDADGLIFQGWDDPYIPRTHHGLLKWKYPQMNSVDFLFEIHGHNDKLLFLYDRGKKKLMKGSKVVFKDGATTLHDPLVYSGKIVECSWDFEEKVWVFMRVRTDKSTPNEFNTYMKVMRSIRDNITEEVLLNEMNDIIRLPLYELRVGNDRKANQQKNEARASR